MYPVVSAGRAGIKSYVTGHITSAGTLGFDLPGKEPFQDAIDAYCSWTGRIGSEEFTRVQELPPVDLNILFYDQSFNAAVVVIRSLKILDTSFNISLSDVKLTGAYSFMCASISNMADVGKISPRLTTGLFSGSSEDGTLESGNSPLKRILGNETLGSGIGPNASDFFSKKTPPIG